MSHTPKYAGTDKHGVRTNRRGQPMKTRPYDERDGLKIWLTRSEQQQVLDVVEDDPRKKIALQLGMHGLRSDEIVDVEPRHFYELADSAGSALLVSDGKTGRREIPVSDDLRQSVRYLKNGAQRRKDEPVIDIGERQLRNWIEAVREQLASEDDRELTSWGSLSMHDLRRSWATDAYYSLAFAGVPIAEQLTLSYGGWAQTPKGRQTFREDYLGPVPDHITAQARNNLALP